MYQVSIDHKEQLAKIDARLMVRAHMLNAIPTDGGPIATWEVREYVTAMVGPLMPYMMDGTTGRVERHAREREPLHQHAKGLHQPRWFQIQHRS